MTNWISDTQICIITVVSETILAVYRKTEHRQETSTFSTLLMKAASKGREGEDGRNLCVPVKYLF